MTRILIVEDDMDCREALQQILLAEGYEVLTASTGLRALDVLHGLNNEPRPDLVILDLMMPELDGSGFLIAKNSDDSVRNIPVIVVTAMNGHEARARQLDGTLILIHKPYELEVMLTAVHRISNPRPTDRPPA